MHETSIPPPKIGSDIILVCFGDSATHGAVDEHYPSYLEAWINPSSDDVVNEGKNGETSGEGLSRLRHIIDSHEYPNAKVYAYWEGGNDVIDWVQEVDPYLVWDPANPNYPFRNQLNSILSNMKDNLRQGVYKIQETTAQPILGNYYYLISYIRCPLSPIGFLLPRMTTIANHYVDEITTTIYDLAAEEQIPLADINGELGQMPYEYYHDCNHASAIGNEAIAEVWYDVILPYLFENTPPDKPQIIGPTSGKVGEKYNYTFVTSDPEEDDVYYWIEWGDDQVEEWIGPFDSGDEIILSHIWDEQGKFTIRAKAKDTHEGESPWGTLDITMPFAVFFQVERVNRSPVHSLFFR
jgi:lysophospholipase L1-like esterase